MPAQAFGTARWDFLYAAQDRLPFRTTYASTTTAGSSFVIEAKDKSLQVTSSTGFRAGELIRVQGSGFEVYMRVTKVVDATHLMVRPIDTRISVAGNTQPYPYGSSIAAGATVDNAVTGGTEKIVPQTAHELVIDLTEAPTDETFTFLIVASATAYSDTAAKQFIIQVRGATEVDDPLLTSTAHAAYHQAIITQKTAGITNGDRYPYNAAFVATVASGNRWSLQLQIEPITSGHTVTVENMRIFALRVDTTHPQYAIAGSGGVGQNSQTTTSSSMQNGVSLPVPAGVGVNDNALLVACATIGNTDATYANRNTDCELSKDTTAIGAEVSVRMEATTDVVTVGFARIIDAITSSDTLRWRFAANAGTALISQQLIAYLPLDAIPGISAFAEDVNINVANGDTPDFSQDIGTAQHASLDAGYHVAFIQWEGGTTNTGDRRGYTRPRYSSDPTWIYDHNQTPRGWCGRESVRTGSTISCFWFHRALVSGTTLSAVVDQRIPAGGNSAQHDAVSASFLLRERAKFNVRPTDKTAILAELQTGAVYASWASLGSDKYEKHLMDVGEVASVQCNADLYTKVATVGAVTSARTWHFDATTRVLTIKMDTGDSPADDDRTVLVRDVHYYGRDYLGLTDAASGEDKGYENRILAVPSYDQSLQVQDGSVEAAVGLGDLELAAGTGDLDTLISQYILEGAICTILRGYPAHTSDRRDYDRVMKATVSEPLLSLDSLTVRLFTMLKSLRRPIAKTRITVYQGTTTRDDQLLPHAYGAIFRAQAWRTTHVTTDGGDNTYKFASHAVFSILAVYEDPSDPRTAPSTFTGDTANGQFTVVNTNLDSWVDGSTVNAPDILYVDFVGYAETVGGASVPIETPGRIARHLLVTHGMVATAMLDEYALRALDTRWRKRIDVTASPKVQLYRPPTVGLYLDSGQTVEDALNEVSRTALFYWLELRNGRITVGVPETTARNALGNVGFEFDSAEPWPWEVTGGLTFATTTTKVFEGARAAQISGKTWGALAQRVLFDRPGSWVMSALVALESGRPEGFRLAITSPGDGYNRIYSEPVQVNGNEWTRVNLPVELAAGESGGGVVELVPYLTEALSPDLPASAGLRLWLKADAMIGDGNATGDGSAIGTWTDQSGFGNHATQGTAALKPTYRANVQAGHPAVSFDRTDDELGTSLALAQPYTIFLVYAFSAESGVLGASSIFRSIARDSGAAAIIGARGTTYGFWNGSDLASSETLMPGRWVIHTVRVDGSGSEHWINGVSQGTNANNPAWTTLRLSTNDTDGHAFAWIGEVLAYNVALAVADRQAVETYLAQKWGISDVAINVDNVWLVPVAARVETVTGDDGEPALNFLPEESEVRPDSFFEAEVAYNPYLNGTAMLPTMLLTSGEARGLISTYDPDATEEKTAVATSRRVVLTDVIVSNDTTTEARESAAGIAGHQAFVFGRMRTVLRGLFQGLRRLPSVGEILFHPPTARVPESSSAFPFWLLTRVEDTSNAMELRLEAEREIDPVRDRRLIGESTFPVGAMGLSLVDTAITGWDEVVAMRNRYCRVAQTADLLSNQGSVVHTHSLSHTHAVGSHTHTWQVGSIGAIDPIGHTEPDNSDCHRGFDIESDTYVGDLDNLSRGYDEGGHGHTAPSGTYTTNSAAPTSSAPNAAISTDPGSNEAKNKRVVWRRRSGTSDEIPTNIILGYLGSAAPSGWTRETGLDGFYLKGATPRSGTATTLTADWTPADNSVMAVASVVHIGVGTRLLLFNGSQLTHVIVQSISGLNLTVRFLNEVGNNNGVTYTVAATAVSPQNETAGQSYTPANHDHGTLVPSHAHTAVHTHADANTTTSSGGSDANRAVSVHPPTGAEYAASWEHHYHQVRNAAFQNDSGNSGTAAGSAVSGVANALDSFELMFIKPSGAGVTQIPSGVVAFWGGTTPPKGWSIVAEAVGFFVKGAEAGAAPVGGATKTHTHTFTAASHTYSHTHAVSGSVYTTCDDQKIYAVNPPFVGPYVLDYEIAGAGQQGYSKRKGHRHSATLTNISTTAATLSQGTSLPSGVADDTTKRPLHRSLILIKKD